MIDPEEVRDPRELTPDEAFKIRQVAVLLGWKTKKSKLSRKLHALADKHEAPQACEGCSEPATTRDVEDVPLCDPCAASCPAAPDEDDETVAPHVETP